MRSDPRTCLSVQMLDYNSQILCAAKQYCFMTLEIPCHQTAMPSANMSSFQLEVYLSVLVFYNVFIYSWNRFFPNNNKLILEGVNNSTNHLNCTWRSDTRSWQDWFPDGEVISSPVPQACLYPNSEKDKKKQLFSGFRLKKYVTITQRFSFRYSAEKTS